IFRRTRCLLATSGNSGRTPRASQGVAGNTILAEISGLIPLRRCSSNTSATDENHAIPVLSLGLIAAVHESACGTKRTSRHAQPMSAFGGKADMVRKCLDRWFLDRIPT